MHNFGIENQIPFTPSSRKNIIEQFSTLLMFLPSKRCQISQWVTDDKLRNNLKILLELHPNWNEKAWLIYFLDIVRDSSQPNVVREIARKHLSCYYQGICFWTTRKVWRDYYSNRHKWETLPLWDWEDLFQQAGETFHTLERIVKDLNNFKPEISTKEYIKIICKRNITKWIHKQTGKNNLITTISIDCSQTEDSLKETKTNKINKFSEEQTNAKKESIIAKKEQGKVLSLIQSELIKVEADAFKSSPSATIGKAKIPYWTILLLNYGLNLKQQLTANLLTANQRPIDQSNISRFLDNFRLKLLLKILVSLPEIPREVLDLSEGQEQLEKQPCFQEFVKNNKKHFKRELDELLRESCNSRLYNAMGIYGELDNKTRENIENDLRRELNSWFNSNFQIKLDSDYLKTDSLKIDAKVNLVVANWVQHFIECKQITF